MAKKSRYSIHNFPPPVDFDTVPILKRLADAGALLGELRGSARSLPNPDILLDTLFLQEALASSEIENIVTTQDEAFRARSFRSGISAEAKEVSRYCDAMHLGYAAWQKNRFISENMLIEMFRALKMSREGYRRYAVVIGNPRTGEVIYRPPQETAEVVTLMRQLEAFINKDAAAALHPLVKMALIHHQFESIHPFSDGNGRIGRVLNVLYLTHAGVLDSPILYLSRSINRTRADYYRLLAAVNSGGGDGAWAKWVAYILDAVVDSARVTLDLVGGIKALMADYKRDIRARAPKIYSQELLNALFFNPYTRIDYVGAALGVGRQTARKYLQMLAARGFVDEVKSGRNNYYINRKLIDLFTTASAAPSK